MNLLHKDMVEQFCMHVHEDFMQLIPLIIVTLLQDSTVYKYQDFGHIIYNCM
jgi:hypothetical protein